MKLIKYFAILVPLLLSSCQVEDTYKYFSYTHASNCKLKAVADLHDNKEVLYYGERGILEQKISSDLENFTSLFNLNESIISLKCEVDQYNVPYGLLDIKIKFTSGDVLLDESNILYYGFCDYYFNELKTDIDSKYNCHIFVRNPYWIRMEMPVQIDEMNRKLTFEWSKPLKGDDNIPDIFKK